METQPINQPGIYRGKLLDHCIGRTREKGYPQFVGRFLATEKYDEENEVWVPWAEYNCSITGYLVLFNDKGPLFHAEDCMRALGWDGNSLVELHEMDMADRIVQFTVESHTYNGNTSLQVTKIGAEDDSPVVQGLRKLDPKALAKLDAEYKMPRASKPAKAAKATAPPSPPKPKARPEPEPEPNPQTPAVKKCTKEDAWAAACKVQVKRELDEETLNDAWLEACEAITDKVDEDEITLEEWAQIRDKAVENLGIPF